MARVLLILGVFLCARLRFNQPDVAVIAFPLLNCWDSNIDLLLAAHSVKDGFNHQMRLFSLLIDLFLGGEEAESPRLNAAMIAYRSTPTNNFQILEVFNYSKYANKSEAKEFLNGISSDDFKFDSDMFNETFPRSSLAARFGVREDAQQVSIFVVEFSQANCLLEEVLKFVEYKSKLFFILIDDITSDNRSVSMNAVVYARVKNYAVLQHSHEIPYLLCGACYTQWSRLEQRQVDSLQWTLSCYILFESDDKIAWSDALKSCEEKQATLVSIETAEELDFLRPILYNVSRSLPPRRKFGVVNGELLFHIGLTRDRDSLAKRFKWTNNAPVTFTHWFGNERPNGGFVQSCGAWIFNIYMDKDGWDDFGCGYRNARFYLCEANVVTVNPEYMNKSAVTTASTDNINSVMLMGELIHCSESGSLVSASSVISLRDHKKCALVLQHQMYSLEDLSQHIALFNCEDQQAMTIAYSFICDHKLHCSNGRDEEVCRYRQCDPLKEFTCKSKQCVPMEARCDLYNDCYDGSDEVGCTDCRYMRCQDGTCLPTHWWFDEETDCIWGDFAQGYTWDIDPPSESTTGECAFMCNRVECVTEDMMDNGVTDCTGPEGPLDETLGVLEKCSCQTDTQDFNSTTWSPCCVYYRDRYDSPLGCRNMMHLQGCRDYKCPDGFLKCPGSYCIPMHQAHDGKNDCPLGEDEMVEFFPKCTGNFLCMLSHVCVYTDLVCDGYPHCPHGDDELNCNMSCRPGFLCVGGAVTVYKYDLNTPLLSLNFIDPRIRHIDLSGVILSDVFPNIPLELSLSNLNVLRLSGCKIEGLDNKYLGEALHGGSYLGREWFELSGVHTMDVSHNNIQRINEYSIIKTMLNLRILNLSNNYKLQQINTKAFELLGFPSYLQVLDLSFTGISNTLKLFDSLNKLTHLNLSHTPLADLKPGTFSSEGIVKLQVLDLRSISVSEFYPETFKGVVVSTGLYTSTYTLCCPQVRGLGIDADVCYAPADPLSTCADLMGDVFQRVLLWLAGLLAVFGNVAVIVYRIRWTRPILKKAYGMFVVHLAVSDIIMGVYLLIIASADVYYRDNYVWNEKRWKSTALCQIAGFVSLLSSQVSTCFIFLITLDRFLVLKYPFSNVKLSRKVTTIVCSLVWLLGFAVALIPLFPKHKHWRTYSSNGMCLGLPLTSQRLPGWQFSTTIFIAFNFFMFVLILIGQITIYRTMAAANKAHRDICGANYVRQQQDFAVARQLFLVAMTNFICWFPIAIMGIISLGGYEIGLAAYAWSTVMIMPINSALNPVLYTIPALLRKFTTFRKGEHSTKERTAPKHLCSKCQVSFSMNTTEEEKVKKQSIM